MAKEVDLLSYWMPILRNIKEFKEIAIAEEPELRYILEAIDRTLANMFIDTMDESAVSRYERMMGIYPDASDTLDTRRFRVKTKWNDYVPYTETELYRRLVSICGSPDLFDIEEHYKEYLLKVTTHVGVKGSFDMVASTLDDMIPANLLLELANILDAKKTSPLYLGGVCCTAFGYMITNDINAEVDKVSDLTKTLAMAIGGVAGITMDLDAHDVSSMAANVATGTGYATTTLIVSEDIN